MQSPYAFFLLTMVDIVANLHIAHWRADTRVNEHKALGDLYDTLDGHLDTFAELALGRAGSRELPQSAANLNTRAYGDLIAVALGLVTKVTTQAAAENAQDLINVLADMEASLNHARYFLMLP